MGRVGRERGGFFSSGSSRRVGSLVVLTVLCAAPTVVFALLDHRPPDDDDPNFTAHVRDDVLESTAYDLPLSSRVHLLVEHVLGEGRGGRPNLCTTPLYLAMAWFEPCLRLYRLAVLPYVLGSLLLMYLCGREVLGHRFGLLALFLLGTMPAFINYSRKWETQVHGSALTLVSLYVALRVVRGPWQYRRGPWLALGLVVGLALYTHPLTLCHSLLILASVGSLTLVRAWRSGKLRAWTHALVPTVALVGLLSFVHLMLGSDGGARFSILDYVSFRLNWFLPPEAGFVSAERRSAIPALVDLVLSLFRMHWMPALSMLLVLPGLLAAPLALSLEGHRRTARALRFLVLLLAVHIPCVWFTHSRIGIAVDWLCLWPATVLVCLLALERIWHHHLGRPLVPRVLFVSALIAVGSFNVLAPMVASLAGPDPLVDCSAFSNPLLRGFTLTEKGQTEVSHHLISHEPSVAEQVISYMRISETDPERARVARLGLWDLRYASQGGLDEGASTEDHVDRLEWISMTLGDTESTRWPFVFAGYCTSFVEYQYEALHARFHVVRVHVGSAEHRSGGSSAQPRALLQPAEAKEVFTEVTGRFGVHEDAVTSFEDPAGWFLLETNRNPGDRRMTYAGEVLLVDLGPGRRVEPLSTRVERRPRPHHN